MKKCPLLQRYLIEGDNEALEVFDVCLGADCEAWDESADCCSVKSISRTLTALGAVLGRIADNLSEFKRGR